MDQAMKQINDAASYTVPDAFAELPEDIKRNIDVVQISIDKCGDEQIPKLFEKLPQDIQRNLDIVKSCIGKCYGGSIPSFFEKLPQDIKSNVDIAKSSIAKCRDRYIPIIFEMLPQGGFLPKRNPEAELLKREGNQWLVVGPSEGSCEVRKVKESWGDNVEGQNANGIFFRKSKDMDDRKSTGVECNALVSGEECGEWIYIEDLRRNMDLLGTAFEQVGSLSSDFGSVSYASKVFELLPEDLRNKEMLKLAVEKSGSPAMFSKLPEDIKSNLDTVKSCIGKCDSGDIPKLFELFPQDLKLNMEVVKVSIAKCGEREIPKLFTMFPEDVKSNADAVNHSIEKCGTGDGENPFFPDLFNMLSQDFKSNTDVVKHSIEKCGPAYFPRLFEEFSQETRNNPTIATLALEKLAEEKHDWGEPKNGDKVPEMFELFGDDVKKDMEVIKSSIETCNQCYIPSFFSNLPKDDKSNVDVVNVSIENCDTSSIPDLFEEFPQDTKKNMDVVKSSLEKCSELYIPKLFDQFPEELKKIMDVSKSAMEKCPKGDFKELFSNLPEDLRKDSNIRCFAIEKFVGKEVPKESLTTPDLAINTMEDVDGSFIPFVFSLFEKDLKLNMEVVKASIKTCDEGKIPEHISVLPEESRGNCEVARLALEKYKYSGYGEHELPNLYDMFAEEVRNQSEIKKFFSEKVKHALGPDGGFDRFDSLLSDFFKKLPEDVRNQSEIKEVFFEKVKFALGPEGMSSYDVKDFFKALPEDLRNNMEVVNLSMEKGGDNSIQDIFENIPEDLKKNIEVVKSSIEKCSVFNLLDLFSNFPEDVRNKSDIAQLALETLTKSSFGAEKVPKLFSMFSKDIKSNLELVNNSIGKCEASGLLKLFEHIPQEQRNDVAVVTLVLTKMSADTSFCSAAGDIPDVFSMLSPDVRNQSEIRGLFVEKAKQAFASNPYNFALEKFLKELDANDQKAGA